MRENGSAASLIPAGMICIGFTSETEKDPTLGGRIEVKQGLLTGVGASIMFWLTMLPFRLSNLHK